MKPGRFCSIIIIFLSLGSTVNGQQNHYVDYSKELSIPAIVVWDMEQDSNGLFWFITHKGLMNYDGVEWHLLPDSLNLPTREKSRIKSLRDGRMVACGYNKDSKLVLSVMDNEKKWTSTFVPKDADHHTNIFIHQDEESEHFKLLYTSLDSLFIFEEKKSEWSSYLLPPDFKDINHLNDILYIDNSYYFLTNKGVLSWNNFKMASAPTYLSGLNENPIYKLHISQNKDTVVAILDKKLFIKINESITYVESPGLQIYEEYNFSSLKVKQNRIYYTSSGSLYVYELNTGLLRELHAHNDRLLPFFSDFILDDHNNLWVSTPRGISKITNLAFTNFTTEDGLEENEVSVILHLKNGYHYLGHNFGFTVIDENMEIIWKHEFPKDKINRAQDGIVVSEDQVLIANSNQGLLLIDTRTKTISDLTPDGIDFVNSVRIMGDTIWVNDLANIYGFRHNEMFYKRLSHARRLYFLDNSRLIFLKNNGFSIIDLHHPGENDLDITNHKNLYSLAFYMGKTVMCALDGLYELKDNQLSPFELVGEINTIGLYGLARESSNSLWLGTSEGIYSIKNDTVKAKFDISSGLIGNEINRAAMSIDYKDKLWIGTPEGLSILDMDLVNIKHTPPKPHLLEFLVNGIKYNPHKLPQFKFTENDLNVKIAALKFNNERKIQYRYRLLGLDSTWQINTNPTNRFVRYNYLPSGRFIFELQVREEDGKWSNSLKTSSIIINNPYYYQAWFILLILLLVSAGIYFVNRFYTYEKMNKKLEQNLTEKMKEVYKYQENLKYHNKELEDRNNELDTLVYSISHDLRAPILSALGLVNIYNLAKSDEERQQYIGMMETSLTRLDGFIQNILKISRNSRLELVKSTIDLNEFFNELIESQKHREEAANINFEINANNLSIYTDKDRLGMILMNFISNAIIYSDLRKEQSLIRITAINSNTHIQISIYDNGVGIREDYLKDIFKIFVRANEAKIGSGLGLYIAQQSAQKIGAEIGVQSEFGKWTEFLVSIPNSVDNSASS